MPWYPVTGGTIVLAVAITAAYLMQADISKLIENEGILRGQWWRFLTSVLPHAGIFHLAFNVYWTWVFGTLIEEVFGSLATLALFACFAVASGAWEYALLVGGMGLSGVGYGLFGLTWVLHRRDPRFVDAMDMGTTKLFVIWFFLCIGLTVTGIMPVANIAHGVGAVTGALAGWMIISRGARRAVAGGAVGAILVLGIVGSTRARPWVNLSKTGGDDEARLAYDALQRDDNAAALRWLRDAVRMEPLSAGVWWNLGVARDRIGDRAGSLDAFDRSLQLSPNPEERTKFVTNLVAFADDQLRQNEPAEAERRARRATQLEPEFAPAWSMLAAAQKSLGKRSDSVASAEKAMELEGRAK